MFAERRPLINEIKMERGCVDCGYAPHPAALHFDHRDPSAKRFNISGSEGRNLPDLLAEIDNHGRVCRIVPLHPHGGDDPTFTETTGRGVTPGRR